MHLNDKGAQAMANAVDLETLALYTAGQVVIDSAATAREVCPFCRVGALN